MSDRTLPAYSFTQLKNFLHPLITKGITMSNANSNNPPNVKPFGDTDDPLGFYQLLVAHVTWLAVHNFSLTTTTKRALYVRAFGLWCLERDIVTPCDLINP